MSISRRNFLHHGLAVAGAATAAAPHSLAAANAPTPPDRRIPLGVSTYSYWHFLPEKYPIENVIEDAVRMGFDGVEILHRQMAEESTAYMNKLKRLAFVNGLGAGTCCRSTRISFLPTPPSARKRSTTPSTPWTWRTKMGIPAIRLNTGRWNTIASFDDLMKAGGQEPPIEGYKEDDAFKWVIDSIEKCLPHARRTRRGDGARKPLGPVDQARKSAAHPPTHSTLHGWA